MAIAVSIDKRIAAATVWRENFLWLSLSYFSGASVAILIVSVNRTLNLGAIAMISPLLIVSYLTYQTALGRVADANRHVEKISKLYLSTIESLALAIDAKDQVTHGHIRRVQEHSVRLARELGVSDADLIKAVEAASLLHDMGKLAIPEHILNKPGRLTPAEFEIMKTHAAMGAEILAAVDFPYPVVPIVRHHHENWDGSGYPDGLSGTDIPLGARILAVVDCFDALTSDRPYRPRLPDTEALQILSDRRGNMYDPLVVDTFFGIHESMDVPSPEAGSPAPSSSTQAPPPIASERPHNEAATVRRHFSIPYRIEVVAAYIATLSPSSVVVWYAVDRAGCCLRIGKAWGDTDRIPLRELPLGRGLAGWVALNRAPIVGAAPGLEVGAAIEGFRTVSAIPLCHDSAAAVLTIHWSDMDSTPFQPHLRIAHDYLLTQQASKTDQKPQLSDEVMQR